MDVHQKWLCTYPLCQIYLCSFFSLIRYTYLTGIAMLNHAPKRLKTCNPYPCTQYNLMSPPTSWSLTRGRGARCPCGRSGSGRTTSPTRHSPHSTAAGAAPAALAPRSPAPSPPPTHKKQVGAIVQVVRAVVSFPRFTNRYAPSKCAGGVAWQSQDFFEILG